MSTLKQVLASRLSVAQVPMSFQSFTDSSPHPKLPQTMVFLPPVAFPIILPSWPLCPLPSVSLLFSSLGVLCPHSVYPPLWLLSYLTDNSSLQAMFTLLLLCLLALDSSDASSCTLSYIYYESLPLNHTLEWSCLTPQFISHQLCKRHKTLLAINISPPQLKCISKGSRRQH